MLDEAGITLCTSLAAVSSRSKTEARRVRIEQRNPQNTVRLESTCFEGDSGRPASEMISSLVISRKDCYLPHPLPQTASAEIRSAFFVLKRARPIQVDVVARVKGLALTRFYCGTAPQKERRVCCWGQDTAGLESLRVPFAKLSKRFVPENLRLSLPTVRQ